MKNITLIFGIAISFVSLSYGNVSKNAECEQMRDYAFVPMPTIHKSCKIDNLLEKYISCRNYYSYNVAHGLNSNGDAEVDKGVKHKGKGGYSAISNYNFFNKEVKKVLLKEIKNEIEKSQSIMCVKNTEASLFDYRESIAEHEWCYAPNFLKAFDGSSMNENRMKFEHFIALYKTRDNMLLSKEKPKKRALLCGVYLDCMRYFINANHTQASGELVNLYNKTKKECRSNYFRITVDISSHEVKRSSRAKGAMISGPKVLIRNSYSSATSVQIMRVDPKHMLVYLEPLKSEAKSHYSTNYDTFDKKSCSFINKSFNKTDKNLKPRLARFKRHDVGLVDDAQAMIELKVSNEGFIKIFKVPWSTLKNNGFWSGQDSSSRNGDDLGMDKEFKKIFSKSGAFKNIMKMGKQLEQSDTLKKSNENTLKMAGMLGLSKKQACTGLSGEFLFNGFAHKEISKSFNTKITIEPASKMDIEDFKMIEDISNHGGYNPHSNKPKKNEDKKAEEEYDNMTIDDLEMFTK